jgi:hypothetical protein
MKRANEAALIIRKHKTTFINLFECIMFYFGSLSPLDFFIMYGINFLHMHSANIISIERELWLSWEERKNEIE